LEAFPDRIVHFVLDLHLFERDLNEIAFEFSEEAAAVMVVDSHIGDPWTPWAPAIHTRVAYSELRVPMGTISFTEGCEECE
jgi:hypothetical protein